MDITSRAFRKMVDQSEGNLHDINHLLKVWGFARHIGLAEGLDADTQLTLELAAIVHDIACPLCRVKYGSASGANQEKESDPLVRGFFADLPVEASRVDRIAWLVCHHHTYADVQGMDYQVLLEADFLVNAHESAMSAQAIESFGRKVFRTATGRGLLASMYRGVLGK